MSRYRVFIVIGHKTKSLVLCPSGLIIISRERISGLKHDKMVFLFSDHWYPCFGIQVTSLRLCIGFITRVNLSTLLCSVDFHTFIVPAPSFACWKKFKCRNCYLKWKGLLQSKQIYKKKCNVSINSLST